MKAIEARHVYKLYGDHPHKALEALHKGATREELEKKYKTTAAVIDMSVEVEQGEIFVLMGLSGSGKSTFVRCLNLLHRPTSGSISVWGQDILQASPKELRTLRSEHISMVFQNFGLLPHLTVFENVRWALDVKGVDAQTAGKEAQHAIELVGLKGWEDSYPNELSGGMGQRVGLARAFASQTDIILMDEAFSALDPLIRSEMQDQLLSLQQELSKTIVFITHDLNEAMYVGDHIAVMRDGRLIQTGTPEDILENPANDYIESFVENVDRSRVLTVGSAMVESENRIKPHTGPRAALRRMREQAVDYLYVVNRDRHVLGYVRARDAVEAARLGEPTLESRMRTDFGTALPDSTIGDALSSAVESSVPLAVIDADGKFLGIVPDTAILAALDTNDHPEIDAMGRTGSFSVSGMKKAQEAYDVAHTSSPIPADNAASSETPGAHTTSNKGGERK